MSLKSKIEAVIYASEEPVTLQQLVGLLAGEAQAELDRMAADQRSLPLDGAAADGVNETEPGRDADENARPVLEAGTHDTPEVNDGIAPSSPEAQAAFAGEVIQQGTAIHEPQAVKENDGIAEIATPVTASVESGTVGERSPAEGEFTEPSDSGDTQHASVSTAGDGSNAEAPVALPDDEKRQSRERERAVREHIRRACDQLIREYAESDRGIEIREVASGFRMGTKPEFHDAVRGFVKGLKPALKLTLPALETLAVVAYKQPVTAAEISEIRGVDSAGVLGGLMARKLIATAGRKQVIGRPMLYKTTRDFLLRFGLKDIHELPSMDEFERMASELVEQEDLPMEHTDSIIEQANARGDAEMLREANAASLTEDEASDESNDAEEAEATSALIENDNDTPQQATAESAAGGTNETADEQNTTDKASPAEEDSTAPAAGA